ncbi:hypothetical protein AVEN_98278-1 [Araneus ventricosus]|uniref:RNase H type-1 domain-containing protein n=1 Tax=Araneus ventricosus TaxID=182803 RepID=A0A4Y2IDV3_ARAVE|nr:hypothetical protein AVEN_98278-1 [Araneus ventricosus]
MVAATLIDLEEEDIPVRVLNINNKLKNPDKGAVIARCEPVVDIVVNPQEVKKQKDHPAYLELLALEIINDISVDAVKVYTDGSRNDSDCTGSGIYIKTHNQELKIQRRNPDFCSVFCSELIAIDEDLGSLSSFSFSNQIWILTDSSSIQHLAN